MELITAVIPSLNPDKKLLGVIDDLLSNGFNDIIVVNDGSGSGALDYFTEAQNKGVTLLTHDINRGKGRALKTAFQYIIENRPDGTLVVTLDGDGQHKACDAMNVALRAQEDNCSVLGVRDFTRENVPTNSRNGNGVMSLAFRLFWGVRLKDTQTGLRAFPSRLLPRLMEIYGERFEYETNVLLNLIEIKEKIAEVPIETVYIEGNASSHYRPFADSLRVFFILANFALFASVSLLSAVIDNAAFYVLSKLLIGVLGAYVTTLAFLGARIISSLFNFFANRNGVFRDKSPAGNAAARYYTLAVCQFAIAAGLLNAAALITASESPAMLTVIKIVIDCMLFVISYKIQQKWVFRGGMR